MRRRIAVLVITTCAASVACGIDAIGTATPLASLDDGSTNGGDSRAADAEPRTKEDGATDAGSGADGRVDAPNDAAAEDTGLPLVACSETGGVRSAANHCYFPIAATTQPVAQQTCAAAGAHLVSVNDAAEHTLLASVGTGDRWIGLQAAAPTNDRAQYNWVTGEPKTVTYWYVNDPDNMGPCVALHGTLQVWVDRGCSDTNAAICERE